MKKFLVSLVALVICFVFTLGNLETKASTTKVNT